MKNIAAIAVLLISTAALAAAQTGVSCHRTDDYTEVCKYTDGRVNETIASSMTYTAHEWAQHVAAEAKRNRWTAQNSVDSCLSGNGHDVCIRISTACKGTSHFTKAQCGQV